MNHTGSLSLYHRGQEESRYPMTFAPKGWYVLMRSAELSRNKVQTLHYFDQDLVVFRDSKGKAHLLDPYCPHLGAHLGHGGVVQDDELVCPYHHWRFNGKGRCTSVPGCDSPPRTGVRSWPLHEVNGLIFVFYSPDDGVADFSVPEMPEWSSREWVKFDEISHVTGGHVLELQENLLDEAHFVTIHRRREPLVWSFETKGRLAHAHAKMVVGPEKIRTHFDVTADFVGPGITILRTRGVIEHTVLSMGTPIDAKRSHYRILFLTKKVPFLGPLTRGLNFALCRYARFDFFKEAGIWEKRRYPTRPIFMEGDRSLPKYRKWYKQFLLSNNGDSPASMEKDTSVDARPPMLDSRL